MTKQPRIKHFYDRLYRKYGEQHWWPAETTLECILGAILTQNTSWKNAEKAILNLRDKGLVNVSELLEISTEELAETVRSSGYYNQKALKIKNFIYYFYKNYRGSFINMQKKETEVLRSELIGIKGIGPETADTILLYALGRKKFVIDRYTQRVLTRHGIAGKYAGYYEMQELVTANIEQDAQLYNEYHALIVRLGKDHCKKKADCNGCPLEYDLSE